MLIDNSDSSATIRNASYLIPIGICFFSCLSSISNMLTFGFFEFGVYFEVDSYLNYWLGHIIKTTLMAFFGFLFTRSLWRRIVTGELNCARLFISLLILSIVFFGLWNISYYFFSLLKEARFGTPQMESSEHNEFVIRISPYTWGVEYVIEIVCITFATSRSGSNSSFVETIEAPLTSESKDYP